MKSLQDFLSDWNNPSDTIDVQSSGSTGTPKVFQMEKKRMLASAKMTCDFLQLKPGDSALLCMSLDHIGAQMMVVRCIERDLRLIEVPATGHPLSSVSEKIDFAAMVPIQVYNSLQIAEEKEKLKGIKHLIIGGGSIDEKMEKELQQFPNSIWSTYGMTETLSHVALRKINGKDASYWYKPFDGVRIWANEENCLCIHAPYVCEEELTTNDIVEINEIGLFKVIGRKDNVINSGGIKIQIEKVENAIKALGEKEFAIGNCPDEKFGQIIVLLTTNRDLPSLKEKLKALPKYWQPKAIINTDNIPLTETGKIARTAVQELINQSMKK